MSEAELHVMRARLRGGLLNKAKRGDLRLPLPIGLVYNPEGQTLLDPISRYSKAYDCSLPPFGGSARPSVWSGTFARRESCFRSTPRVGRGMGNCCGETWISAKPYGSCTTPGTQELSSSGELVAARKSRGVADHRYVCRASSGTPCWLEPIPVIFPGKNMRTTSDICERMPKPMAKIAPRVRHVRVQRSCRDWWFAVFAAVA